jgi:tyrosyl-tRNA synthetase
MDALPHLAPLQANVEICLPDTGLADKLALAARAQRPLILKLGFDPTAPDLHLGHAVVLKKLRQFQDLGHTIVIIIGDFTARIGDPTGKNKARPALSAEQVAVNARTYVAQLSKILDVSKCQLRYNSEWLSALDFTATIQLLSRVTLAQIMQRTDFHNRFAGNQPIALHELVYPLLQGFDSTVIRADIEMGGTDQLFNCTMGRQLQEGAGEAGQAVVCMPLLRGIDGSAKMSKSEGNTVGLTDEPATMFGKLMSIPDALLPDYLRLATNFTPAQQDQAQARLTAGENPMALKKEMSFNVVEQYHGIEAATQAQTHFAQQVQNKQFDLKAFRPVSLATLALDLSQPLGLVELCSALKPELSKTQVRRLIAEGAVLVNGDKVTDAQAPVSHFLLPVQVKVGKREYFELHP